MADIRDSQTRLNAYIPETLLNWYNDAGNEPPHVISPLRGAVVCVDASGFTAMTRRLAERGKLGPELLTSRLNLFFDEMSAAVFERGGDVLKFAGDAFWAYFPDEFAPDSFLGAALSRLKNVNGANDLAREYPLTIHIGAEFGEFWLASLGDPAIRLEIEPVGQIIERVFRLCDQAETNQLVIGAELAERCQRIHNLLPLPGDVFLVEAHYENRSLTERGYTANRYDLPRLSDHLRPYLPIAVAGRLESERAGAELQSEHRDVVVLFAQFEFHSSDATHAEAAEVVTALNSVLGYAFGAVRELGGSISRIDPYLSGHKLLILFGAPVKGENDELMAIACARRLTQLNDERFKIRIGAALGSLFCGDVGASRRREYTVMGECANMAARLMSQAAFGQVLIDGAMRDNLPTSVTTSKIELALKGIGRRVPCFQLTGVSEESQHSTAQTELVGLHAETDRLKRFWDGALQGKRRIVSVTG
ncbi:MAG: adenylate/guanylate cyclase domain-containing protein, partial [Candidatus Zixiibacteriota bacterium]